ncbi:prepilin peptidase [Paramicrobacterium agarici]|uniref:prepilin peptidase n=1 Tax=Paramicrobacterium agarici TaxID=630514 RepID=UPI00114DECD5|nr:prepilin peptidase [Microbacterium agarici]TQO21651.1 leader peptidase (prepilin peptidase)/N-methyltransferase [Microbacterium agarici]
MTEGGTAQATRSVGRWLPMAATLVTTGLVLSLAVGWSWLLLGLGAVAVVTWPLIDADIAEHRLPNALVLPCYPIALVSVLAHAMASGSSPVFAIVIAAASIAAFGLMHVLGGMGMGDVKLVGVLGLLLGALGATAVIVGVAAAFLFGAVAGAWAMATQQRAASHRIPFGPFLLVGFWFGVLASIVRAA